MIKVVGRALYDRVNSYHRISKANLRLVTTTHDSWTLSSAKPEDTAEMVKRIMERGWPEVGSCGHLPTLWCPVDVAIGRNWGKNSARNTGGLRKWIDALPAVEKVSLITGR
jgi:hypothetical protein